MKQDFSNQNQFQSDQTVSKSKLYRFAYARITVIALSALLFAGLLVSIANDMYAFVKPNREITLKIETPMSAEDLTQMLEESGVIANPTIFRLYVGSKQYTERLELFCGNLVLNSNMSYREILIAFSSTA